MPGTYQAALDSWTLDLETLDESRQKAVARHEYPMVDGADLQPMGMHARTLNLRAHFFGGSSNAKSFLEYIAGSDDVELVHPEFGSLHGQVDTSTIHFDDSDDVTVDFSFVEQRPEESPDLSMPDIVVSSEQQFAEGQSALMGSYSASLQANLGADGLTVMAAVLTDISSAVSQIQNVGYAAMKYVAQVDADVDQMDCIAASVTNPPSSVIETIDYGQSLPGRVVRSVARAVERQGIMAASVADTPSRFLGAFQDGITALSAAVPNVASIVVAQAALHGAAAVAGMYAADEAQRDALRTAETEPAFDAFGNRVHTDPLPSVYTVNELEGSLAALNELLQNAIDQDRENGAPYKAISRAMVDHVSRTKLEREHIVQINVGGPVPLHAICRQRGLSHEYAERLLAINPQIEFPNFVSGPVNVYA